MDTIYYGGSIITMEEPLYAEAMVVRDAKILCLGTKRDLLAKFPEAQRICLDGHTLLPGFIDAHSHITAYAQTLSLVSLEQARDVAEIGTLLAQRLQTNPPENGAWLLGFGYDHNRLAEKRHPTRQELDAVSDHIPIMITHASGHMGVCNRIALELLGLTDATPDPEGGRIGRDETGALNGYLEEKAFTEQSAKIPAPSLKEKLRALDMAQQSYLSYGITTAQDGLMRAAEFEMLTQFAIENRLILDVVGYADLQQHQELYHSGGYHHHFRMGGYKIFLDGSPQGKTAWMTEPYENETDGYRGYPIHSDETLQKLVKTAVDEGVQLLAHCNGDAAADQLIRAFQAYGTDGTRPVMIHAQTIREDQIISMAKLSMIASFFVAHTYYWGDIHLKNLGMRAKRISPAGSADRHGLVYTFHQDTPVLAPDMMRTIWCAVNRETQAGVLLEKKEAVSTLDALRAVTIYAAYQYFEEQEKGSLREGKHADFVILDRDPLITPREKLYDIKILETIKDGRVVYQRKGEWKDGNKQSVYRNYT